MDFIGRIRIAQNEDALEVKPLRLYYAGAKAKGETFGLALRLKAKSIWREDNVGLEKIVFDQIILKKKVNISKKPVIEYFDEKGSFIRLPIIPYSSITNPSKSAGWTSFTFYVAEVGAPPELLKIVVKLFSKSKGDLGKLLTTAAVEKLSAN